MKSGTPTATAPRMSQIHQIWTTNEEMESVIQRIQIDTAFALAGSPFPAR